MPQNVIIDVPEHARTLRNQIEGNRLVLPRTPTQSRHTTITSKFDSNKLLRMLKTYCNYCWVGSRNIYWYASHFLNILVHYYWLVQFDITNFLHQSYLLVNFDIHIFLDNHNLFIQFDSPTFIYHYILSVQFGSPTFFKHLNWLTKFNIPTFLKNFNWLVHLNSFPIQKIILNSENQYKFWKSVQIPETSTNSIKRPKLGLDQTYQI